MPLGNSGISGYVVAVTELPKEPLIIFVRGELVEPRTCIRNPFTRFPFALRQAQGERAN